jgi:hypothetical protein
MRIDRRSLGLGFLTGIVIGVVIGLTVPMILNSMFIYKTIELKNGVPQTVTVGAEEIIMEYLYLPANFASYNLYL